MTHVTPVKVSLWEIISSLGKCVCVLVVTGIMSDGAITTLQGLFVCLFVCLLDCLFVCLFDCLFI